MTKVVNPCEESKMDLSLFSGTRLVIGNEIKREYWFNAGFDELKLNRYFYIKSKWLLIMQVSRKTLINWIYENGILLLIAFLQIIPPILRLIPCLKDKEWVGVSFNCLIVILVIIIREARRRKFSNETNLRFKKDEEDIVDLSGSTVDLSAATVTVDGKIESLSTLLNSLYKDVYQLQHAKGYRTGRHK